MDLHYNFKVDRLTFCGIRDGQIIALVTQQKLRVDRLCFFETSADLLCKIPTCVKEIKSVHKLFFNLNPGRMHIEDWDWGLNQEKTFGLQKGKYIIDAFWDLKIQSYEGYAIKFGNTAY